MITGLRFFIFNFASSNYLRNLRIVEMIFHITTLGWWNSLRRLIHYESPEQNEDGFIKCCTSGQLMSVIEEHFTDQKDLIILHIDPDLLKSELRYERYSEEGPFPHIYGKLNRNSIIDIEYFYNSSVAYFYNN